jgi:hypothetical protein
MAARPSTWSGSGYGDASACQTMLTQPDDAERLTPDVSRPVPGLNVQIAPKIS